MNNIVAYALTSPTEFCIGCIIAFIIYEIYNAYQRRKASQQDIEMAEEGAIK